MRFTGRNGAGARAVVRMSHHAAARVARSDSSEFDVVAAARLVARRTAEAAADETSATRPGRRATVEPCVAVEPDAGRVTITVWARDVDGGAEVEAMAACIGAALTLYELVKSIDAGVLIDRVELVHGAAEGR